MVTISGALRKCWVTLSITRIPKVKSSVWSIGISWDLLNLKLWARALQSVKEQAPKETQMPVQVREWPHHSLLRRRRYVSLYTTWYNGNRVVLEIDQIQISAVISNRVTRVCSLTSLSSSSLPIKMEIKIPRRFDVEIKSEVYKETHAPYG